MRVLVVDDNQTSREILEGMLESYGLRVMLADSGETALEALKQCRADDPYRFILLDYRMPGLNGVETAHRIREQYGPTATRESVIIMVTAFSKEAIHQGMEDQGIRAFLAKPVTPAALLKALTEVYGSQGQFCELRTDTRTSINIGKQHLAGARILVVEDNRINQQIMSELLEQAGISVVLAGNGQEAVNQVTGSVHFDAVLMDLQMPVMDGYAATGLIRQTKSAGELPIIAITAHALTDERDRCLAADMNGHISKPINPEELYKVLGKWVRPRNGTKTLAVPRQKRRESALPASLPGIAIDTALARVRGNSSLLRSVIIDFRAQNVSTVASIRQAIAAHDRDQALSLAHALKGVAGNIGAEGLAATVRECEDAVRNGDESPLPGLLDTMELQMAELFETAGILERTETLNTATGQTGETLVVFDRDAVTRGLDALRTLLSLNRVSAAHKFRELKALLPETEERAALEKQIDRFDFKGAQESLMRLAETIDIAIEKQP